MRDDYLTLVDRFTDEYPHLAINMSGPWKRLIDDVLSDEPEPWIVNFKNLTLLNKEVHYGSSGETMYDALRKGMDYLAANPDCAVDFSQPTAPQASPAPRR